MPQVNNWHNDGRRYGFQSLLQEANKRLNSAVFAWKENITENRQLDGETPNKPEPHALLFAYIKAITLPGQACYCDYEGYPSRQEGQAMLKFITVFLQEESGATVVEYAILASLIGIVAIATILLAGGEVRNLFEGAQTSISDATG
ncbi:Flp family type IVb pilin [Alcanivorax sp.]|uniref:Flp family type IVb pilin n=2 Tax=Alcanivorax sp. TaxID=1872427 RepID=UPI00261E93E9|nr:Flp family type IVb pilin [Alcanivorax sp.]